MTDAQAFALLGITTPLVILGVVGMIRGYRMTLRVWKGGHRDGDSDR